MKKINWVKVKAEGKLPEEKKSVHIFVNDNKGFFNIYTAHIEQGLWFLYDPFTHKTRIFTRQQYVTHWAPLIDMPAATKRNEKRKASKEQPQPSSAEAAFH